MLQALLEIVPEARPAEIKPAEPLREQLDIDSMDFINFIVELDERLGVAVPEAEYGRLGTLDACVDYLAGKLGTAAGPP